MLEGAKTEVTLNGYSGGSEASTWAAAFAPKYAPKLDIVGVAAGGNFPDLDYTTQNFDNSIWYGTEIGVLESLFHRNCSPNGAPRSQVAACCFTARAPQTARRAAQSLVAARASELPGVC